jgi:hypothetical protein
VKRPAPKTRTGVTTGDVRKDLSKDQLAGIGSVAILFNELEARLDLLLYRGLGLGDLWLETVKRISGLGAKQELATLIENWQRYANLFNEPT